MDPGRLAASNRLLPVFMYAYAWQEGVAPPSSRALTHLLAARYANVLRGRRREQEPGKVLAKVVPEEGGGGKDGRAWLSRTAAKNRPSLQTG